MFYSLPPIPTILYAGQRKAGKTTNGGREASRATKAPFGLSRAAARAGSGSGGGSAADGPCRCRRESRPRTATCGTAPPQRCHLQRPHRGCSAPEPRAQHPAGATNPAEKDLRVMFDEKQSASQSVLTAQKANSVLGCVQSSVASRSRDGILLLYPALLDPNWSAVYSAGAVLTPPA